jgi:hypothetical protein
LKARLFLARTKHDPFLFFDSRMGRTDHRLSTDTLQAAYQQAREWLANSQSLNLLSRLNAAAGKLAASVWRELSRDEAIDLLLTKPYDLDQRLLEYEHDLIKQALAESDGKVSHAAKLVGKSYQGLAKMIENKHPDLRRRH